MTSTSSPSAETLLPCPFCNCENVTDRHVRDGRQMFCQGCGASVAPSYHGPHRDTLERAREAWNRRAPTQIKAGETDELDMTALAAAREAHRNAEENPNLIQCPTCSGKGDVNGDWCDRCGGGGYDLADGEENRPLNEALRAYLAALSPKPGETPIDRNTLGRMVREAWVRWAETQPNPKPSWLVPYDDLSEPDKEADRQIGETMFLWSKIHIDAAASLTPSPISGDESRITESCGCVFRDLNVPCRNPECKICHDLPSPIFAAATQPTQPDGDSCHADRDGDCKWPSCPQIANRQSHCPLDTETMAPDTYTGGNINGVVEGER